MGLLANWEYPKKEITPFYEARGGDYYGTEGVSDAILRRHNGNGGGGYTTFYTVPAGKVFKLKWAAATGANGVIRLNGTDWLFGSLNVTNEVVLEQPVEYPAGTVFAGANTGGAADIMWIYGIEESPEINRERRVI